MRTNYVLIDYESVQVKSLELLQQPQFKIRVFLGPNNTRLPTELAVAIQRLGDRANYIQLDTPGQNALDFHIAYYLGRLSLEEPDAYFHIISRDKGFDPLIKHLKGKGIFSARSESIEEMPCFSTPKIVPAPPPKLEPVKATPAKAEVVDEVGAKIRVIPVEATVRPSLAFYNTVDEVDLLVSTVQRLANRH